jgi:SAM-dependent methyltransferase
MRVSPVFQVKLAMSRPAIYRILENPLVYGWTQRLLAPGSRSLEARHLPQPQMGADGWVLDVGCGPGTGTPAGEYRVVGVDPNPDYISKFTGGPIDHNPRSIFTEPRGRRRYGFACSATELPFADGSFDEVRTHRVFHHLPDDVVVAAVREMVRVTKPGGRTLIMDAILPERPWFRPIAWCLLKLDRGEHTRHEARLQELIFAGVPDGWQRQSYLCSYLGVQAVVFTRPREIAMAHAAA